MITAAFDLSQPMMGPGDFYGEQKHLCDTCIVTFSSEVFQNVLEHFPCEKVGERTACNGNSPIYLLEHEGKKLGFYLTAVGSSGAAHDIIDANWLTGATTFVMFGSCGSLNREKTKGRYIIPTEAYREEGISYHYAPPSHYLPIPQSKELSELFQVIGLPIVTGRVWTTDAFYRETRKKIADRQAEGCIAVEMELAGVQAVCSFHGFRLYDFLVAGDVLDEWDYDISDLKNVNHLNSNFDLALQIAKRLG